MKKKTNTPENPEFTSVDAALKRAQGGALTGAQDKNSLYIWKDGKIVNVTERLTNHNSALCLINLI